MTHVKVARFILLDSGKEIVLSLNDGGEAQLWDSKTWTRYHTFVQDNPAVRGTAHYPWTYVEDMNPPPDDLANYKLLPEKTGGKEFQININAKN